MKQVVSLMLGAVLLAGCGRGHKKPGATAPSLEPPAVAAAQPKTKAAVSAVSSSGTGSARIVESSIPPVAVPPVAIPRAVVPPAGHAPQLAGSVPTASGAPARRTPEELADFSILPPSRLLRPDSAPAREVAKAQELFRQGRTDAALEVLAAAAKDPALKDGSTLFARMEVGMLLASDRLDDAKVLVIEYATNAKPEFCGPIVTRYLIQEKGDAAAAVAWTDHLATLPLQKYVATLNYSDQLVARASAGRLDEVIQSVPALVTEYDGLKIFVGASLGMIKVSNFDGAERFMSAAVTNASNDPDYAGMKKFLSGMLEKARAGKTNAVPDV